MMAVAEQINNIKMLSSQLYEQDSVIEKEHRRLKTFNKIIVKANESSNQKELVQSILEACLDFANFDIGGIYLIKDHKSEMVANRFVPRDSIERLNHVCIERPELRELFQFGKPIYVTQYNEKYPETSKLLGNIQTLISIPILYNDRVKGCINIGAFGHVDISSEDCDILRTLGKHLGHVLHRFEIEQELELKLIDLEVHAEELRNSNESLSQVVQHFEESQQQLDIERDNFRTLFNKMTDMIFVISFKGDILAINDAVRNRLGYPNGNLIGKPITIVHDAGDCSQVITVMAEMIRNDRTHCLTTLISSTNEHITVDTRIVKGLWNGYEVLYNVAREVINA